MSWKICHISIPRYIDIIYPNQTMSNFVFLHLRLWNLNLCLICLCVFLNGVLFQNNKTVVCWRYSKVLSSSPLRSCKLRLIDRGYLIDTSMLVIRISWTAHTKKGYKTVLSHDQKFATEVYETRISDSISTSTGRSCSKMYPMQTSSQ